MDYRRMWFALKEYLERRESYLEDRLKTDKKRTEDLTRGELCGLSIIQQFMFDMEADAGAYTIGSEAEETERLRRSIELSIQHLTKESARKFLSQLPMYDENGQLIKEEENA
jgi:hypothetical protein